MSNYIKIILGPKNEFRCKGCLKLFGFELSNLSFKIDTGCPMTSIPLMKTSMPYEDIGYFKKLAYEDASIQKQISFGVNDSITKRNMDKQLFREGRYTEINSVSCTHSVDNFTIDGCNLGAQNVRISYTRTGNILIGMDILSKLDVHIGKTSEGETIFLACPLDRINDEYLLEVERLFNTGSNIQSAQIRNRLDISN